MLVLLQRERAKYLGTPKRKELSAWVHQEKMLESYAAINYILTPNNLRRYHDKTLP